MYVSHLQLTNFRNYRELDLHLPSGSALIFGDNAQGKTNLLEAIYLLSSARSPRAESDLELIHREALAQGEAVARLVAEARRRDGPVRVEMVLALEPGNGRVVTKRIRINGLPRRASDLVGQMNAVLFSAQDIDVVTGPPLLRRRYLDAILYQVDRAYLAARQSYSRVLTQRNHLLRRIRERQATAGELEFWNGELASYGGSVFQARARALAELGQEATQAHAALTGGRETLALVYQPHLDAGTAGTHLASVDQDSLASLFVERLADSLEREVAAGATLVGPHRDDIAILLDGAAASSFASRGQQRTVALALRLAEARYLHNRSGEWPVLLLDDVLSELDRQRCAAVLAAVAEYEQILVTSTEPAAACLLPSAACFRAADGRIEPWREPD